MKAELFKKIEESFSNIKKMNKQNYTNACEKFGEKNVSEFIEETCENAEDKVVEQVLSKYSYYYDEVKKDQEPEEIIQEYEKESVCNDIMHDILAQLADYPLLTIEEEKKYATILKETREKLVIESCNNTKTEINYETIFASINKPEQLLLIKDLLKYNIHKTLKNDEEEIFKKYLRLTDKCERILTKEDLIKEFGFKFAEKSYTLLSEEELKEQVAMLIERRHTKTIMTESNLRLIIHISKRYSSVRTMSKEDMYMEGCLGLDRALERYDVSRGFRFSTYATWWIRQGITRAIADQARTMRIPVHMLERYIKYTKATKELSDNLQRIPTLAELAEYTGFTLEQIFQLDKLSLDFISLETPVNDDSDSSLADFVPSDQKSVEDQVSLEILPEILDKVMTDHLTPREKAVITLRYGLEDGCFRTLESVGNEFDVTRERIRQIELKALRKLRRYPVMNQLNEFRH